MRSLRLKLVFVVRAQRFPVFQIRSQRDIQSVPDSALLAEVVASVPDGQYGAVGLAHYPLSDAPEEKVSKTGATVGRHHENIRIKFTHGFQDTTDHIADVNDGLVLDSS